MHPGNARPRVFPQRHEVLGVALHERIVDHRIQRCLFLLAAMFKGLFGIPRKVVAAAEALARPFNDDHMHLVVGGCPTDRSTNFPRRLIANRVEAFRSVEGEAGDAAVGWVFLDWERGVGGRSTQDSAFAAPTGTRTIDRT